MKRESAEMITENRPTDSETKANWDKHSGRRAGKQYNINQNNKKGEKNRTYKTPPNPNKKPKPHKKK